MPGAVLQRLGEADESPQARNSICSTKCCDYVASWDWPGSNWLQGSGQFYLRKNDDDFVNNVIFLWFQLTKKPIYENLSKVAAMMMEFFDNDIEVFWVSKAFFNFLSRLAIEMPKLSETTNSLLEKEDPDLYK